MTAGYHAPPQGGLEFLTDPHWFPYDLDRQTGAIEFVKSPRAIPTTQDFIEIFAGEKDLPRRSAPAALLRQALAPKPARPKLRFIWHTAYCCSTAIAKALDIPGVNMVVSEPLLLTSVSLAKRQFDRDRRGGDIAWLPDVAFKLLDRAYEPGVSVTIKASPASNYLIPDAALRTSGKMLFLYSDCRSFLLASMRYGENRRRYVREIFNTIRSDSTAAPHWSADQLATLTDLEVAALTWQLQMMHFADQMRRYGNRAASLDCDAFLAAPREITAKIWNFLELPGDPKQSAAISDPSFVGKHVKYPEVAFDLKTRRSEEDSLSPEKRDEIDRIVAASTAMFPQIANALPLPNPLASIDKDDRQ